LFTLPITLITLCLFSLVINMLMLYITSWVVPGVGTVGIVRTFVAALIISIATSVLTWIFARDD
jgi:putative membrane protein